MNLNANIFKVSFQFYRKVYIISALLSFVQIHSCEEAHIEGVGRMSCFKRNAYKKNKKKINKSGFFLLKLLFKIDKIRN